MMWKNPDRHLHKKGCLMVINTHIGIRISLSVEARRYSAGCAEGASAGSLRLSASRALQASPQNAADSTMEKKSHTNPAADWQLVPKCHHFVTQFTLSSNLVLLICTILMTLLQSVHSICELADRMNKKRWQEFFLSSFLPAGILALFYVNDS